MAETITKQENEQQIGRQLVRRINAVFLVSGIVSLLLTIVLADLPLLLYQLLLISCTFVVAIRSHRGNLHLLPYTLNIFFSLVIVWAVSLVGFYGPNTEIGNEFDAGRGTFVSDKSVSTAIESSILWPDMYTAAIFGFNCNGYWNCSYTAWIEGVTVDYIILTGGVVIGNILVNRQQALLKQGNE